MKVKMLKNGASAKGTYMAGAILNVPREDAEYLIKTRQAVEADGDETVTEVKAIQGSTPEAAIIEQTENGDMPSPRRRRAAKE